MKIKSCMIKRIPENTFEYTLRFVIIVSSDDLLGFLRTA